MTNPLYHIQHRDKNAGPADFEGIAGDLLVTNIFYTIQGEGPLAGIPAVFIRLAGCNRGRKEDMGCAFCDTSFELHNARTMSIEMVTREVADKIGVPSADGAFSCRQVVITGGEPMLQPNMPPLCQALMDQGFSVQIETNGDLLARPFLDGNYQMRTYVKVVISPKTVAGKYRELRPGYLTRADAIKFVVDARSSSPYHQIPDWAKHDFRDKVWVSPLTIYQREVAYKEIPRFWTPGLIDWGLSSDNYKYAADLCMEHGFRFSMQQHLFMGLE